MANIKQGATGRLKKRASTRVAQAAFLAAFSKRGPVGKDYELAHEWEEDGLCEPGYLEDLYGMPAGSLDPRPQED